MILRLKILNICLNELDCGVGILPAIKRIAGKMTAPQLTQII